MPWARFDDRFPSNRKIRMLGDGAFRLYVSAVCWSAENLTDGFIPHDELLLVSDTRDAESACEELVKRNLWTPIAGGWLIHDYHEYNPTAEQVRAERKAKTLRQERWRENKRRAEQGLPPLPVDASTDASPSPMTNRVLYEVIDVDASTDPSTDASRSASTARVPGQRVVDASTDASHDTSGDGSQDAAPRARVTRPVPAPTRTRSFSYEKEEQDLTPMPPAASPPDGERVGEPGGDDTPKPTFDDFWSAYPRKVAKGNARTAWAKAIKNGTDPADIIAGAERYQRHCDHTRKAPQYTRYPASWLNGECWDDALEDATEQPLRLVSGGHQTYRDPDQSVYYDPKAGPR